MEGILGKDWLVAELPIRHSGERALRIPLYFSKERVHGRLKGLRALIRGHPASTPNITLREADETKRVGLCLVK